jgi:formyl-CoA transferase
VEPIRLGETPATPHRPAPALGQHTEEVLAEFGYGGEEIVRMREEGVVQ